MNKLQEGCWSIILQSTKEAIPNLNEGKYLNNVTEYLSLNIFKKKLDNHLQRYKTMLLEERLKVVLWVIYFSSGYYRSSIICKQIFPKRIYL